ncbi:MAG: radical SAM protein [Dehalococcoidia bacterium]|jgi:MoaA/NifB/PqqE/SkfB family radical SAM enzyme
MNENTGTGGLFRRIGAAFSSFFGSLKLFFFKLILKGVILLFYLSDNSLLRVVRMVKRLRFTKLYREQLDTFESLVEKNHPFVQLGRNIFHKSERCRGKLLNNLLLNALFVGSNKRVQFSERNNLPAPWFFVVSPTMRCNLKCVGCYAAQYKKENDLPYETLDKICRDAKTMGIYLVTISGGEPFIRQDLFDLFQKHNDIYFQVFTNGTLIDKKLTRRLARLGNVAPVIAIEGFEAATDQRRGKGTYRKVIAAMDRLREAGVIFGFSTMPTSLNWEIVASEDFYRFLVEKGCSFGWLFQYIPIGRDPDLVLMMKPEQRLAIREMVRTVRSRYPLLVSDFWNDGDYVNGCLAGGRHGGGYFHINTNGDVEPCVFAHFAQDNIKTIYRNDGHLWDVLRSEFFCKIRAGQPWNEDHRMCCMIIDNPQCLRRVVLSCDGVYPTEQEAEKLIRDDRVTSHLDNYSSCLSRLLHPDMGASAEAPAAADKPSQSGNVAAR